MIPAALLDSGCISFQFHPSFITPTPCALLRSRILQRASKRVCPLCGDRTRPAGWAAGGCPIAKDWCSRCEHAAFVFAHGHIRLFREQLRQRLAGGPLQLAREGSLIVTFEIGTDPDFAQVLVQNRAAAMAQLPRAAQEQGVVRNKKSTAILQIVALTSPKGTYDALFLSIPASESGHV